VHRADFLNTIKLNLSADQRDVHHLSLFGQSLHDCLERSDDFGHQCFVWVIHVLKGALKIFCGILFYVQLRVVAVVSQKVKPEARSC